MPLPIRSLARRFDPRVVGSLGLWVDFSDRATITLDPNSKVEQINDKSGNGRNLTQTTASKRFVLGSINGLSCADFGTSPASDIGMNHSSVSMFEAHVVCTAEGHTNNVFSDLVGISTSTNPGGGFQAQNPFNRFYPAGAGGFGTPAQFNATAIANMDSTGNQGLLPAMESPCVFQMWQTTAFTGINRFGNDREIAGRAWKGRIGELLLFTANLNDDSRRAIRRYLAYKWQITVAIP